MSQGVMSSENTSNSPGLSPVKDRTLALAPRRGPEISSRACLWVSPRPRHRTQCWLANQWLILLRISRLPDSHGRLRSKKPQNRAAPCELAAQVLIVRIFLSLQTSTGNLSAASNNICPAVDIAPSGTVTLPQRKPQDETWPSPCGRH
jgi:hypothetical protein